MDGRHAPTRADQARPALEVKQDKGAVSLCKGSVCTELAGLPASDGTYDVAVNADGTRAAVGGDPLGGFWTYDATTGKKLKAVNFPGLGPDKDGGACFNAIAFAGELIYAATDVCAGPGADGAFYSWAGKKVATVSTNPYGYEPLDLGNNMFAVGNLNGSRIDFVDITTGKVRSVEVTQEECEDCELFEWIPSGQRHAREAAQRQAPAGALARRRNRRRGEREGREAVPLPALREVATRQARGRGGRAAGTGVCEQGCAPGGACSCSRGTRRCH